MYNRFINRRWRFILPVLLALILSACSQVQFAYRQIDTAAQWYIGSYVSLTKEQKQRASAAIEEVLKWHCEHELQQYAASLAELADSTEQGALDLAVIHHWNVEIERAWGRLGQQLVPAAVDVLISLSDEQISELEANLAESLADNRDEYAGSSYSSSNRSRRIEKNMARWFGKLDDSQKARIKDWEAQSRPLLSSWNDSREHWNRLFIQTLRSTTPTRSEQLTALLLTPENFRLADHIEQGRQWRESFNQMLDDLYQSASPKQRIRAANELRSWQQDFEELACRPDPSDTTLALTRTN